MSLFLCRFSDAGVKADARAEAASEKRQGTKSRWVGHWLAASAMGI
jgi:hypothetical protein